MLSSLLLFLHADYAASLPGWILSEPLSTIAARLRLESEAPHSLSGIPGAYLSLFSIDGACVTCGLIFTPEFLCSFALTRRRCFWRRVIVSTFFVYISLSSSRAGHIGVQHTSVVWVILHLISLPPTHFLPSPFLLTVPSPAIVFAPRARSLLACYRHRHFSYEFGAVRLILEN